MRKLIELAMVFLLGGVLALYFLGDKQHGDNRDQATGPQPAPSQQITKSIAPAPSIGSTGVLAKPSPLEYAQRQLQNKDIDGFMATLQQQRTADNDKLWRRLRAEFFRALEQFKAAKQYRSGIDWLTAYLQSEYDDVLALQALAEFHYLQGNYLAAIDNLYLAKSYAHDSGKISQILASIRSITAEYANRLHTKDDHLGLLDLYQRLVSAEPEYSPHYIGLAEAYIALGNQADARRTLDIIAYDPETDTKVHQLLNLIEKQTAPPQQQPEAIALTPHGNHLLARVLFNNRAYGHLLLDTGASLTVITTDMLSELSLDRRSPVRTAWFNTANGVVEAPIYVIDRMSIGGQTVDNLEVAVMELSNHHINGLLGMNFLQHFQFSIDQQGSVLYLSPRG